MEAKFLNLYPNIYKQDRRQNEAPVEFERRSGSDRRQNVRLSPENKETFKRFIHPHPTNKEDFTFSDNEKAFISALSPIVPIRRVSSIPDKFINSDYAGMTGTVAVAGLLLPEDLRDTKDGVKQILHAVLPSSFKEKIEQKMPNFYKNFIHYDRKYSHKEYQTPFSFIRGSYLEKFVNKFMCNKYGFALYEADKPFIRTKFGNKLKDFLGVKIIDSKDTARKTEKVRFIEGKFILINSLVETEKLTGSYISKLICRAMQRTTVIGAATLAAISLTPLIQVFNKPDKIEDKAINGGKQILKSTVSVVSTLSGIGLLGALFAPFGPVGSLTGMAIGSILGSYISNKFNRYIK